MEKARLERTMNLIARENLLFAMCKDYLNMEWDDDENCLKIGNYHLAWGDYEIIEVDAVPYEDDTIDSILIFGDGTIEFRLAKEKDALNHAEFPFEIVDKVIENLFKKVKQKYEKSV